MIRYRVEIGYDESGEWTWVTWDLWGYYPTLADARTARDRLKEGRIDGCAVRIVRHETTVVD